MTLPGLNSQITVTVTADNPTIVFVSPPLIPTYGTPEDGAMIYKWAYDPVTVTWTDPEDCDWVVVECSLSQEFNPWESWYKEVAAGTQTLDLRTIMNGFRDSQQYFWRLRAVKGYVSSPWTDPAQSFTYRANRYTYPPPAINKLVPATGQVEPRDTAIPISVSVDYETLQMVTWNWDCSYEDGAGNIVNENNRLSPAQQVQAVFLTPLSSELTADELETGRTYTLTFTARNEAGTANAKCDILVTNKPMKHENGDKPGNKPGQTWVNVTTKGLRANIAGNLKNITIPKSNGPLADAEDGDTYYDTSV